MGTFTVSGATAGVAGAVAVSGYAQLHTGDPGSLGTANIAAGIDRVAVPWAAGTDPAQNASITFPVPTAGSGGLAYSWVSLWSASVGGQFTGTSALDVSATYGGLGSLVVACLADNG